MGKKKIALFYDTDTESGRMILEFLAPFAKRKSDIVGELILLWIAEHGTNVPIQWLDRRKGELGAVKPYFPSGSLSNGKEEEVSKATNQRADKAGVVEADLDNGKEKMDSGNDPIEEAAPPDASLIMAGLSSFM